MLWTSENFYLLEPFELEKDLEAAILEVQDALFGSSRIYLDVKKKMGGKGRKANIPDGYLIDLISKKEPRLYVVENELAIHHPLKHIAVQILEFSLSFETSPQKVKEIIKAALENKEGARQQCAEYAANNGYENIDFLLEKLIYKHNAFNALVIIDEIADELETVLLSRFKFPVEIITLQRYKSSTDERIYQFEPFLSDVIDTSLVSSHTNEKSSKRVDISEIDTVVVPARNDGFEETFINEDRWYAIRMHASMLAKIKYIAAYRVAPISAITHIAPIQSIDQWKDTNKYIVTFSEPAKKMGPIKLVPKGNVKAPQAPRYTSFKKLAEAQNLDEAF